MAKYSTPCHKKIMEYLETNEDRLVRASDIDLFLKNEGLEVNPSTIYRYLNHLSEDGKLLKYVATKGEMSAFQYVKDEHSHCHEHLHMHCKMCGRIVHLDCDFMDEISGHIMDHHGFRIDCSTSILYGICKDCGGGN